MNRGFVYVVQKCRRWVECGLPCFIWIVQETFPTRTAAEEALKRFRRDDPSGEYRVKHKERG